MVAPDQIVQLLVEDGEQVTLRQLFENNEPEEWVLDMFGEPDLDVPLRITEVDPSKLFLNGAPLPKSVDVAKGSSTWRIVKGYMRKPGDPIVVEGNQVLDGQHRSMAAFLAKRLVKVVDVAQLGLKESSKGAVTEADEDDALWKEITPPSDYTGYPTIDQVTFNVVAEPEDIAPDFEDEEDNQRIQQELEDGNEWAWCSAHVIAKWTTPQGEEVTGDDYLGGCNYLSKQNFMQPGGYYDDMKQEAFERLIAKLREKNKQLGLEENEEDDWKDVALPSNEITRPTHFKHVYAGTAFRLSTGERAVKANDKEVWLPDRDGLLMNVGDRQLWGAADHPNTRYICYPVDWNPATIKSTKRHINRPQHVAPGSLKSRLMWEDGEADWKELTPDPVIAWLEQAGFKHEDSEVQWILRATRRRMYVVSRHPNDGKWDVMVVINGQLADNVRFTDQEIQDWLTRGGFIKKRVQEDEGDWKEVASEPPLDGWLEEQKFTWNGTRWAKEIDRRGLGTSVTVKPDKMHAGLWIVIFWDGPHVLQGWSLNAAKAKAKVIELTQQEPVAESGEEGGWKDVVMPPNFFEMLLANGWEFNGKFYWKAPTDDSFYQIYRRNDNVSLNAKVKDSFHVGRVTTPEKLAAQLRELKLISESEEWKELLAEPEPKRVNTNPYGHFTGLATFDVFSTGQGSYLVRVYRLSGEVVGEEPFDARNDPEAIGIADKLAGSIVLADPALTALRRQQVRESEEWKDVATPAPDWLSRAPFDVSDLLRANGWESNGQFFFKKHPPYSYKAFAAFGKWGLEITLDSTGERASRGTRDRGEFVTWLREIGSIRESFVAYHASPERFKTFDTSQEGAHFGTIEQAGNVRKHGLRKAKPYLLSIENPLRMRDIGVWNNFNNLHAELARSDVFDQAETEAVWAAWQSSDAEGWEALKRTLEAKGYDGIVYENEQEGPGDSYIAFRSEQIKPYRVRESAEDDFDFKEMALPQSKYKIGDWVWYGNIPYQIIKITPAANHPWIEGYEAFTYDLKNPSGLHATHVLPTDISQTAQEDIESRAALLVRLLIEGGPVTPERLERIYTKLYGQAAGVLKQHNPCQVKHGPEGTTCVGWGEKDTLCCKGCQHHDPAKGCQADDPLTCKTWLCPGVEDEEAREKLNKISQRASRLGFYSARGDKARSLDKAQKEWDYKAKVKAAEPWRNKTFGPRPSDSKEYSKWLRRVQTRLRKVIGPRPKYSPETATKDDVEKGYDYDRRARHYMDTGEIIETLEGEGDWKEVMPWLGYELEKAGWSRGSDEDTWVFPINQWMTARIRKLDENQWQLRVVFGESHEMARFVGSEQQVIAKLEQHGYLEGGLMWKREIARTESLEEGRKAGSKPSPEGGEWKDVMSEPRKPGAFTVTGSNGEIVCDQDGFVVQQRPGHPDAIVNEPVPPEPGPSPLDDYADIVRVDVDEWEKHYPGENIVEVSSVDILDLGLWTKDGKYCEPDHEWRKDFAEMRHDAEEPGRSWWRGRINPQESSAAKAVAVLTEDDEAAWKDVVSAPLVAEMGQYNFDGDTMTYPLMINGELHHWCWSTNEAIEWVMEHGATWKDGNVPRLTHIPPKDSPLWPMYVKQDRIQEDDQQDLKDVGHTPLMRVTDGVRVADVTAEDMEKLRALNLVGRYSTIRNGFMLNCSADDAEVYLGFKKLAWKSEPGTMESMEDAEWKDVVGPAWKDLAQRGGWKVTTLHHKGIMPIAMRREHSGQVQIIRWSTEDRAFQFLIAGVGGIIEGSLGEMLEFAETYEPKS